MLCAVEEVTVRDWKYSILNKLIRKQISVPCLWLKIFARGAGFPVQIVMSPVAWRRHAKVNGDLSCCCWRAIWLSLFLDR